MEAETACRKSVQINPSNPRANFLFGYVLDKNKKLDEAIAQYRKAIELDPKYVAAYHGIGNALRDQKKPDGSISVWH